MNEIISALELALEKARTEIVPVRYSPIDGPSLTYQAVFEMGIAHIKDTLAIFRHVRRLKNELEAARKPGKDEGED